MSVVDFEAWAAPGLKLTLGGRTYMVQPPSVDAAKQILAAAVRGEVNLSIVDGPIPDEVQRVLDSVAVDDHPALGNDVYQQMVDDGVPQTTIDRMSYYAVFYWARSREYADWLATLMWTPRELTEVNSGDADPKG